MNNFRNFQFDKVLRAVFVLVFVAVLASCPMPDPGPQPGTDTSPPPPTAEAGDDQIDIIELGAVTLNATGSTPAADTIPIKTYLWEQSSGPGVTLSNNLDTMPRFKDPFVAEAVDLVFSLLVVGSNGATASDTVTVRISPSPMVDADGDSLIEIDSLAMLHNMRYNLAGTSYDTDADDSSGNAGSAAGDTGLTAGCPSDTCTGYELTQNLNFDIDGDGSSYTGSSPADFALDPDDNDPSYFNVAMGGLGGWEPIGVSGAENAFATTFEGNGHTITNLAIKRESFVSTPIGFFGSIGTGAVIRNIGLVDNLAVSINSVIDTGTGIGGLVGFQPGGSIIASYTTGDIYGGKSGDTLGALVGVQSDGSIIASYATGNVYSTAGVGQPAGALIGRQTAGIVIASYATGNVNGGAGLRDRAGGLVGDQGGTVIASYATGTADGGADGSDRVGALAGEQRSTGSIVASYATGTADGGAGDGDDVGVLVGEAAIDGTVTVSYGFGSASNGTDNSDTVGTPPSGVTVANMVATAASAGTKWNDADEDTAGAWDFGTTSQAPVLRYADYDGSDPDYSCDMFPDPHDPGGNLCGDIIPGQYPEGR